MDCVLYFCRVNCMFLFLSYTRFCLTESKRLESCRESELLKTHWLLVSFVPSPHVRVRVLRLEKDSCCMLYMIYTMENTKSTISRNISMYLMIVFILIRIKIFFFT